jgi:hypothetical protein
VPGAGDVAIFDGTSSKAAVTTANVSVGGVVVTAAYAGSITQGAGRTITVGASGWVQDGAAFVGSAASVTVNGPFTLTGGAYTSTTGTLSVSGAFTIGAGTFSHNGGTLRVTGPAAPVDVAGSLTVWNLVLAHNNATSKTLDPADLLVADGTLTLTNGRWDGGELRARGPISATSGFDGGNATLRIDGSADQLFTGTATTTAGELPNLVIDKPSGTLTLAGTIRVLSGGWSYVAGTLDPGSSTVVFDSGSLLAGSHSLANVVLRGSGAKSIAAGETLTVSGTLNLVDGTWDGGTLAAHGPLTQAATFDGGSGTLRIDGSADQLFTGSATAAAGALPALVIDKPSGTPGLTCDLGSLASGESATIDLLVSFDAAGTHILEASVSLPSGAVDPDATGDTAAMSVAVSAPEEPPPAPSPSPSPGSSPRPVGTDELPDTSGPPGEQAISAAMAWLALAGLVLAAIAGRRAALSRR